MRKVEAACYAEDGRVIGPEEASAAQPSPPAFSIGGDGYSSKSLGSWKTRGAMHLRGLSTRAIVVVSLFLALVLALASPSYAIDFSVIVTDLKNEPITERSADGKLYPLTLGQLCSNALLSTYQDESNLQAQEKIKRFKLAMKLNDTNGNPAKDVSLTPAEISEISSLAAKLYPPLVVGKILQIIDPAALN